MIEPGTKVKVRDQIASHGGDVGVVCDQTKEGIVLSNPGNVLVQMGNSYFGMPADLLEIIEQE